VPDMVTDQVVRRGLVGDHVRHDAARLGAPHQFRQHVGRIAEQADRHRLALRGVLLDQRDGVVDAGGLLVQVAGAQAEVDAALLALDGERDGAGEAGRQRLGAAHAAEAGGKDPAPTPVAAEMLAPGFGEGLEGALHDALGADVDPAAGGHLAIHEQALAVEFIEVLPGGPLRHQVRIGDQHARRVDVGLEHADRFAGLDQQGLVFFEGAQRGEDLVEAGPVARRPPDAAIHHQVPRILRHFRIEVILQHPVSRLRQPALAGQRGAARGAHDPGGVEAWVNIKARIVVHGSSVDG
jgi:hypothetical protein